MPKRSSKARKRRPQKKVHPLAAPITASANIGAADVPKLIRLNLGAGTDPASQIPGFIAVDRKTGGEIFPVKLPDGSVPAPGTVSEVVASHCLEHLGAKDARLALREWSNLLMPGGRLRVAVPNLTWIAEKYLAGEALPIHGFLYGGQTDENDFHRCGFDEEELRDCLEKVGLVEIKKWESKLNDCASLPVSLNLEGRKPAHSIAPAAFQIPKTVACMSLPRVAFTANMYSALQVATARRLEFTKVEGAFFHQCMERTMSPHVDNGTAEWILAIDYDTWFTVAHFDELCRLMLAYPDADAIAPMQAKRDETNLIMGLVQEDGSQFPTGTKITLSHFNPELVRAGWAHFGLTLIRVSALKKMAHPWFVESPNANGRWEENRTDADIGFWKNFTAAGNKLYLATKVAIGHCQQVVTLPDQELQPRHVYIPDLQKGGLPEWVRR